MNKTFIYILLFISILSNLQAYNNSKKITFYMHWKHQFEFAGFYMAKEKGYYKEYGLDVNIKEVTFRSTPIIDYIEKNIYSFGTSSPTLIVDKTNGKDVVALAAIYQSSPEVMLSLKSSGIKSIKDFKNKTIMMNSKLTQTASYISMINSQGLSLLDMNRINYTYRIDELINRTAHVAPFFISNQTYFLEKKGIPYDVWDPQDYGFDFYHSILYTGSKTLEHDPLTVNNFKEASLKGFKYAFNNIEETVDLILKKYNSQNKTREHLLYEANILKKYAFIDNIPFGEIKKNKIQRIYDVYNILGLMDNKLDIDEFVYEENKKFILSKEEKKYLKNKKTINVCIDPMWMPFEKLDKENNHIGMTADYFKIFKDEYKIPLKVLKTENWNQSLEYSKNGKCDILSLLTSSKEKKKYLNFTKSYIKSPLVLATKNDVPFITDFKVLKKDQKIGISRTYEYAKLLKTKYPNLNIVEIKNNKEGLKKVIEGELFAYIDTLASIGYMFQTQFTGQLKIAGKFDESWDMKIGVKKEDEILLNIFSKIINTIPNETHQNIFNKWIAINYNEEKINYALILEFAFVVFIILLFLLYRQYLLKKSNIKLQKVVNEKTKELVELNKNLESKVEEAISENRQKDKILHKQSKMVSMGEMIGNIAHQWRQPLTEINSNVVVLDHILRRKYIKDEEIEKEFEAIENQTQYLSTTIDDFQNFLKPSNLDEEFNIKDVFTKNFNMFGKNFTSNEIKIITNIDDIYIHGSANELLQVSINILNNARDAFRSKRMKNKYIFIECKEDEEFATIYIKDTAGGIKEDIKDMIFDAYFTTKDKSKGTGLGLYMCYQIITNKFFGELSAHNEEFYYNNNFHKGAVFTIKIPINLKD